MRLFPFTKFMKYIKFNGLLTLWIVIYILYKGATMKNSQMKGAKL